MRPADLCSGRNDGRRQQPIAISAANTLLVLTALVCAGLLAVPLWTALVQRWQVEAIPEPCVLTDTAARQDCLEKLGSENHDIRPKVQMRD